MKNLKVSMKLMAGFMIVVALMAGLTVLAITQIHSIQSNFVNAIESPLTVRESIREFQVNFRDLRISMVSIVAFTGKDAQQCEAQYSTGLAAYDGALAALQKAEEAVASNTTMTQEEKAPRLAKINEIRALAARYRGELLEPMQAAMQTGDPAQTFAFMTAASGVTAAVRESATQMLQTSEATSAAYVQAASDTANSAAVLMLCIAGAAAIISIILAFCISGLISKPLNDMMGYIKQAGETGNLNLTADEWQNCERLSKGKDEIAQTMKAFTQMLRRFVYYGNVFRQVAAKDLTLTVKTLGEGDTFGNAIAQMLDDLNLVFAEINSATAQVNTGSGQIAAGAQTLAQGSTQQAATVQELSASASEIADKTKANAQRADTAAKLAASMMENAEKGSRQMDEMLDAVRQIDQAGKDIAKAVRAIQGIAKETNMISYNCAVEAAKAGNVGKGFAVVADAVRQLAVKSGEAAKGTEALIANSLEKAELGMRIANETAASLKEIVAGISESNRITGEIAASSEEQSAGISQFNSGIGQVAQVVQQNSATAQESAAASEELSGQSSVLHELIAEFKLRHKKAGDETPLLLLR